MKKGKINKFSFLLSFLFEIIVSSIILSCTFFQSVEETVSGKDYNAEITSVSFSDTTMNVTVSESEYLKLTLSPSANQGKCSVYWEYDSEFIEAKTDNFGAIITGKKAGTTFIKAKCNEIIATCIISIVGNSEEPVQNPYIYSNYSVIEMKPQNTTVISSSLYGGRIEDMEKFVWEIKDSSIADITYSRNNCIITSKKAGSTQIICSHPDADYDYTFVLFVYTDKFTQPYITTDCNVMTLNKNDDNTKVIKVDMLNPLNIAYKNDFKWEYADEKSKEVISLISNLNTAEIVPLKNGIANITVSHPDCIYALNITVRVISVVQNVYIDLSEPSLSIKDSGLYSVTAFLKNFDGYVNPESFNWEVPEDALSIADIETTGNTLIISGKKNGIFKIKVTNELCEYPRSILVVLQNQSGSAIDSSMYITTDQNYVQAQVGKSPVTINVRLIGGIDGEDNIGDESTNFTWRLKNGRDNGIVEIQQHTGVIADLSARSAASSGNFCIGQLVINPVKAGEITIAVSHPRCLYETEVSVKVYPESAAVNIKNISVNTNIVKLLNGSSTEISASVFNGEHGEENNISWSSADSSAVTVSPSVGQITQISAVGSGSHQTYVTAHLDGALADKKILVLSADTEEQLAAMKGIYTDNNYLVCYTDETRDVFASTFGLNETDRISWKSEDSSICIVNGDSSSPNNSRAFICGINEGKTKITASFSEYSCVFEVNVKFRSSNTVIESDKKYLATEKTLVKLLNGQSQIVSAVLYNGQIGEENNISWSSADSSAVTVSPSVGHTTQISAVGSGSHQTYVTAHLDGALADKKILVLSADTEEELAVMKGIYLDTKYYRIEKGETHPLYVGSFGLDLTDKVQWESSDSSICIVNPNKYSLNNTQAYLTGLKEGKVNITAKIQGCEDCIFEVTVKDSSAEISENSKYIELNKSVVKVLSGQTGEIQAAVYNGVSGEENSVSWSSADSSVVTVAPSVGQITQFSVVGSGCHQTYVTAHLDGALADKKCLVLSADTEEELAAMKGIYTDNNYIQLTKGEEKNIYVETIGFDDSDRVKWTTSNSDVCSVTVDSSIQNCSQVKLKAEGAGKVLITASLSGCEDCVFEVTVKDFSSGMLVDPKTIDTETSLVRLVNGSSQEIKAILSNHKAGEENSVSWSSSDSSVVTVAPFVGQITQISAVGSGSHQTYVTAHLDGALSDKKVLVLSADTEEELVAMKGIYTDNSYLRISENEIKVLEVSVFGDFSDNDRVTWSCSDSSVCIVNGNSDSKYCTKASVTGIAAGKATVTARIGNCEPCVFEVYVLPEGESSEIMNTSPGYMTTNQNTVVLNSVDDMADIKVTGINISSAVMEINTKWTVEDTEIFEIAGSGSSVTLIPKKAGKTFITVTNPKSKNSIKIAARCGEVYEWTDNSQIYIATDNDVVNIVNGTSVTIGCYLVNTSQKGSFSWTVLNDAPNVQITGLASGICHISAKEAGQAVVVVRNSLTQISKEILVNIANTEEELKGFKYLTTEQNVVTVGENSSTTVSVEIKNASSNIINGYTWLSNDTEIASVVSSGNIGRIYGKKSGTTKIVVENSENCEYPLEFIVNVVDPKIAVENPYIACNNIVTCTVGDSTSSIVAELVGGTDSDNTGFVWNISDSSTAVLYASNNTAEVKALKEGTTQVIVSHPKAAVSRSILVICEPKITTKCYIFTEESIIKMKPDDGSRTITATLVNGDEDDIYDFKWWADSYDKINMDYAGNSCLIEPVSSGNVTIHCSHPKASAVKDIVLYISNYTDFAFESKYVELTTGSSDYFINMEVPATNIDCEISYQSSDSSLCSVSGNISVCALHPGVLPENVSSKTCTVTATLLSKGGVKQAQSELLVSVTKENPTKPYIALSNGTPTIITLNRNEIKNISAVLINAIADIDSAGLNWRISQDGNIIDFNSEKQSGKTVSIKALNAGKAVINITHDAEDGIKISPLTIYVIVKGTADPVVNLNYEDAEVYIGEELTLSATVKNDDGQELEWVWDAGSDSEGFFTVKTNGAKAFITPKKIGTGTVTVRLKDQSSSSTCNITVLEPEKIEFFLYNDESCAVSEKTERKISTVNLCPGEVKFLHYKTIPQKDPITHTLSDNKYFEVENLGYITAYTLNNVGYEWNDDVGTIKITGKPLEGSAIITAKTSHQKQASVLVENSYNYLLTLDKTVIAATPEKVNEDDSILKINYEIRPGNCDLVITIPINDQGANNLSLDTTGRNDIIYDSNQNQWTISSHTSNDSTAVTGIKTGSIILKTSGEVNTSVSIRAVNRAVISNGSSTVKEDIFGEQSVSVQVYYPKHTFYIKNITKKVPYVLKDCSAISDLSAKYSDYNRGTNTVFLGDGEYIEGTVCVNAASEPFSSVTIQSVTFEKSSTASSVKDKISGGQAQSEYVNTDSSKATPQINEYKFNLFHTKDYAVYKYRTNTSSSWTEKSDGIENMYRLISETDKFTEVLNDAIKETSYTGNLVVSYYNYSTKDIEKFYIPVYVNVRNVACVNNILNYFYTIQM